MHWEEAAKKSKWEKAIGKSWIVHRNKLIKVEVIKPLHHDGYIVYYHTGIIIRKATTREVDRIKKWKPW